MTELYKNIINKSFYVFVILISFLIFSCTTQVKTTKKSKDFNYGENEDSIESVSFTYSPTGKNLEYIFVSNVSENNSSLTYSWNFGDVDSKSNTSTDTNPAHTFSKSGKYTVSLTVTSSNNSKKSYSKEIEVTDTQVEENIKNIDFEYVQTKDSMSIVFSSNVEATDLSNLSYAWNFGDNSAISNEKSPTHEYIKPKDYEVKLIVIDNENSISKEVTKTVTVYDSSNIPTITIENVNFSYIQDEDTLNVQFTSDVKSAPGAKLQYEWNFGDKSPLSNIENPAHLYAQNGEYEVELVVTDINNNTHKKIKKSVTVKNIEIAPVIDFFINNISFQQDVSNYNVTFSTKITVIGINDSDLEYVWDFGDGKGVNKNYNMKNPTYTYSRDGIFNVTLTAKYNDKTKSLKQSITVAKRSESSGGEESKVNYKNIDFVCSKISNTEFNCITKNFDKYSANVSWSSKNPNVKIHSKNSESTRVTIENVRQKLDFNITLNYMPNSGSSQTIDKHYQINNINKQITKDVSFNYVISDEGVISAEPLLDLNQYNSIDYFWSLDVDEFFEKNPAPTQIYGNKGYKNFVFEVSINGFDEVIAVDRKIYIYNPKPDIEPEPEPNPDSTNITLNINQRGHIVEASLSDHFSYYVPTYSWKIDDIEVHNDKYYKEHTFFLEELKDYKVSVTLGKSTDGICSSRTCFSEDKTITKTVRVSTDKTLLNDLADNSNDKYLAFYVVGKSNNKNFRTEYTKQSEVGKYCYADTVQPLYNGQSFEFKGGVNVPGYSSEFGFSDSKGQYFQVPTFIAHKNLKFNGRTSLALETFAIVSQNTKCSIFGSGNFEKVTFVRMNESHPLVFEIGSTPVFNPNIHKNIALFKVECKPEKETSPSEKPCSAKFIGYEPKN